MGCKGYHQCWCENRHYEDVDFLDPRLQADGKKVEELCCGKCGKPFIWTNDVNVADGREDGKVEIKFDDKGLVAYHTVSMLMQIRQQKTTGYYHTWGEWWGRKCDRVAAYEISARGTPVIATVPLQHVSMNSYLANTELICAAQKLLGIADSLAKIWAKLNDGFEHPAEEILKELREPMIKSEEITTKLKKVVKCSPL